MKVSQIAEFLNGVLQETEGQTVVANEDLSNVVTIGKTIFDVMSVDNYVKKLVNHIGRIKFVDRKYNRVAPNVMKDGWTYGSILEKIDADLPDMVENESWKLQHGETYNQDTFYAPKNVRAKFFNDRTTFEVDISYTDRQVRESFSSAQQLNGFISMIETKIDNRFAVAYDDLTMRLINNFNIATMYNAFSSLLNDTTHQFEFTSSLYTGKRAINLLAKYKAKYPTDAHISALTPETAIDDKEFLRFAAKQILMYSDRLERNSRLFNIEGRERFTPKDRQHLVLLSEFEQSARVYLYSDTFHENYTKLPTAETVLYWQGTGLDYEFEDTSKIHITSNQLFDDQGEIVPSAGVEVIVPYIIGCCFDDEALGINNEENRIPAHRNEKAEFTNFFYKSDAQFFNDYAENFIVFFMA